MSKNLTIATNYLRAIKIEKSRRVFWAFCLYVDPDFFNKRPILKQVADVLQDIYEGKIRRGSVSMPPRSGKSYLISLFVAWFIGNRPDKSVMRNTCTARLYNKFSYDSREIIKSDKYREIFPHIALSEDKQNLDGWAIKGHSKGVAYFGAGVGGTIIGFGCTGVAITDDLYRSMEDAMSERVNETTSSWKQSTHDSRLEKECPQIDIGTRWTMHDEIGKNIQKGFYDVSIVIPALIDGKSFCEDVKSTEEYLEIQHSIATEIWEAEYMQNPIESKGLLFKRGELHYFTELPKDEANNVIPAETKLGYVDVADEGDDNLAACFGYVIKERVYITDIVFTNETIDGSMPMIAEIDRTFNPKYLRVEVNNQGGGFIREARRVIRPSKLIRVRTQSNKTMRIWNNYGFIKRYFYFKDESTYKPGSQYDLFMRNVLSYMRDGSSKRKDAPDSLAGLAIFIQGQSSVNRLFPAKTEEEAERYKKLESDFEKERQ